MNSTMTTHSLQNRVHFTCKLVGVTSQKQLSQDQAAAAGGKINEQYGISHLSKKLIKIIYLMSFKSWREEGYYTGRPRITLQGAGHSIV